MISDDPVFERARAGDVGAFVDLVRRYDPQLAELAAEPARIAAYVEAYRGLPGLAEDADRLSWLAGLVRGASAGDHARAGVGDMWQRLADALASEAPALTAPELPDRRFPVIPRLQRRRR